MALTLFLSLLSLAGFSIVFAKISCSPNSTPQFPDPVQCDKYFICRNGVAKEETCALGKVYEPRSAKCLPIGYVDCSGRPRLQRPRCAVANGNFPVPDSCHQYVQCTENEGILQTCPLGLIFSTASGICDFPDAVQVKKCSVEEIFNFTCPLSHKTNDGDHSSSLERRIPVGPPPIADPIDLGEFYNYNYPPGYFSPSGQFWENVGTADESFGLTSVRSASVIHAHDCRYFFSCLPNGKARLGLCPYGFVFNAQTLSCDIPRNVPECESYYQRNPLIWGQSPLLLRGTS